MFSILSENQQYLTMHRNHGTLTGMKHLGSDPFTYWVQSLYTFCGRNTSLDWAHHTALELEVRALTMALWFPSCLLVRKIVLKVK